MAGEITTVARPYAEAIFSAAQDGDALEAWAQNLALLTEIVTEAQLVHQIATPSVPRERLRDLILDIAGENLLPEARNLVRLLAANKRLALLPEIERLFAALRSQAQGRQPVQIRTAYPLDVEEQQRLIEALKKKLSAEIELSVEEDPSLIGGLVIRAGDLVIDASLRGRLEKLAGKLRI